MKLTVQVVIEHADGGKVVTEVTSLERDTLSPETLGLTLAESKALLAGVQEVLVAQQAASYSAAHTACPGCGDVSGVSARAGAEADPLVPLSCSTCAERRLADALPPLPVYSAELFRATAAGIPNARLILYPGMGHPAAGKQFARDVLAFLRE